MARGGAGGAASSRGRGKFKVSRGGGRHFSRDIAPIDHEMENLGLGEDSDEEDSDSEEESSDEAGGSKPRVEAPELTRAERKAMKKAGGSKPVAKKSAKPADDDSEESSEEEDDDNDLKQTGPLARTGPSRKEREAADAAAKAERYRKLHAEGKTDQAKGDMARLAEVRKRREAEAAKRTAEKAEADRVAEEKRKAQLLRKL